MWFLAQKRHIWLVPLRRTVGEAPDHSPRAPSSLTIVAAQCSGPWAHHQDTFDKVRRYLSRSCTVALSLYNQSDSYLSPMSDDIVAFVSAQVGAACVILASSHACLYSSPNELIH